MFKRIFIALLLLGTLLRATVPTEESVTKLYIATFDRAPDKAGLDYWLYQSDLHIEGIAASFFDQTETQDKYPTGSSYAYFIEAIYENLFKRDADSSGFDYWLADLEANKVEKSVFILAVINGALGNDAKILENKTQAGLAFERAGKSDVEEAEFIMVGITASADTLEAALCKYSLAGCLEPKEESIEKLNTPPVAIAQSIIVIEDSIDNSITLVGTDVDTNDTLTYTIKTSPSHGTLSGTAPNKKYTPTANYHGDDSFSFTVNDGTVDSSSATVSITVTDVNDAPTGTTQNITVDEDSVNNTITLAGIDADSSDTLTYISITDPIHGILSGTPPNMTYTPTANYFGSDSFTFKINDAIVDSNSATINISVIAINDSPTATAQSITVVEDSIDNIITLAGTDIENDTLTYILTSQPTNGSLTGTAPNMKYTPTANYHGTDTFTFKVNDEVGGFNSATVTITITDVAEPNTTPVATAQNITVDEDSTNNVITLAGTDADSGDTLSYTVENEPTHGTLSGTAPNIIYTPTADYYGNDSFTFTVNDGKVDSSSATVTITITDVVEPNIAPTATVQTITVVENSTGNSIILAGTDADSDTTLTFTSISNPSHGTLSGTAPNMIYIPATDYDGSDSFTFKVNDGIDDSSSATVIITVTDIAEPNITPVAIAQNITVDEDSTNNAITLAGTDEDSGDTLSYIIESQPTHGILSGTAPNMTYTPTANYFGSDSLSFKINDGTVDSSSAIVAITVADINDIPIATAQTIIVDEDSTNNIILLSGIDKDEDDILTFNIVVAPLYGFLDIVDENLVYTPYSDYYGADSFTFSANDGTNDSVESARIDMTVRNVAEVAQIVPLIIIRIEFNDYKFVNDATTWSNKIFGTSEGQLNHYYNEISYGKFQFEKALENDGIEDGIITVSLDENHPGNVEADAFQSRLTSAISKADIYIDFTKYDTNNNNAIDIKELQIMFLVAGGEVAVGQIPGVWAHAYSYLSNSAPVHDGIRLMSFTDNGGYSRFGERHNLDPTSGYDATIGIIAHELGHAAFNLPDLYATTNSDSEGIGNFGLMGSGSWGKKSSDIHAGQTPVHMTGWTKYQVGFATPIPIWTSINNLKIADNSLENYRLYLIPTDADTEYFLIENRSVNGYDRGLSILKDLVGSAKFAGGLSILHIDDSKFFNGNNDDENDKLVDIEEAKDSGLDDTSHRGKNTNLFYSGNSDSFTPDTTPNSNKKSGSDSKISITNISTADTSMSVDITIED